MIVFFKGLYHRFFSRPEAGLLVTFLIMALLVVILLGQMLAPLFVSIVIAYLLDWCITFLQKLKCPRKLAVLVVFILFLACFILLLSIIFPLLSTQINNLIGETPNLINTLQCELNKLPQYTPFLSDTQAQELMNATKGKLIHFGQDALEYMITSIPNIVALVVYLVMVPLLVYFLLMDKKQLLTSISKILPRHQHVLSNIWHEANVQIGNYIRGKALEVLIVTVVTCVTFLLLGLQYSLLLGIAVGVSCFIPYIGAVIVTIPVVIVGLMQWGPTQPFLYMMIAYGIIIALDANVLVTLLFAEAVSIHPISIIIAVLVFGGIWGFWGIFFAIPLASLVKAILTNWPVNDGK
jgi:putative permease